jgi:hypothetical protein
MKSESNRRAVSILLCLLVVGVVSLGAGSAASAGGPPSSIYMGPLNPDIIEELQGLGLNIDLLADDPIVTDVNPNGGLTTGGTEVVITGTEFDGATAVTFGGTAASTFTVDSDTQITATAPAHAAATVQVQVTTAAGASPDTSADDYTYVQPPATTATPTTVAPPTTATPTTAAPTASTVMVTTTATAAEEGDGGISGGWIAFIVVIALIALAALALMVYMLGKRSNKGGPAA